MRSRPIALTLMAVFAGCCSSVFAADAVRVEVICDKLQFVAGQELRVLVLDRSVNGFRLLGKDKPSFDEQGRCHVMLPPNQYVFETLGSGEAGVIVSLRSRRINVTHDMTVRLEALDPKPLTFFADRGEVAIDAITIRTAATELAHLWRAADQPPAIVLSPGETYWVGVLGHRDNDRYAYWSRLRPEDRGRIVFNPRHTYRATFRWRDQSPVRHPAEPGTISLFFPEIDWLLDAHDDAMPTLITNRRYVEVAYSYPTPAEGRLYFSRQDYLLGSDTSIDLGGTITPYAWIAVQRQLDADYSDHLRSDVWLADAGQHILAASNSKVPLSGRLFRADGRELPVNPLSGEAKAALGSLATDYRVEVSYEIDEPVQITIAPQPTFVMRSAHFVMQAIPGWDWRSRAYLDKAERAYACLQPLSRYPGASRITINWLINNSRARGGWSGKRVGAKTGHINMPFRTYVGQQDYFDHAAFLTHETAHTFGYAHGDEMNRTVGEAHRRFLEFRWYAVDHPDFIPGQLSR